MPVAEAVNEGGAMSVAVGVGLAVSLRVEAALRLEDAVVVAVTMPLRVVALGVPV